MKLIYFLFYLIMLSFYVFIAGCFETHYYSSIKTNPFLSSNEILLNNIVNMDNQFKSSNVNLRKDCLLYNMGESIMDLNISLNEFNNNDKYKNICHLRILNPSVTNTLTCYDGYHFKLLLTAYPDSYYITDAAYYLTYIIPDNFNYRDLHYESIKLLEYITTYPGSRYYEAAKQRYELVIEYLKSGSNSIIYTK